MTVFGVHRPLSRAAGLIGVSRALLFPLEYWRSLKTTIFNSYRPELHYMRGPGPKCREKYRAAVR
jgi:hypothetical protein